MLYESQYYGVVQFGDTLQHHGVKGMKWGIRRYQNPDGSLTAAGRAKYLTSDGKFTKAGQKRLAKEEKKLAKLRDRADLDLQKQNAEKHEKRAKIASGVAAASALGALSLRTGLHLQFNNTFNNLKRAQNMNFKSVEARSRALRDATYDKMTKIANKPNWGKEPGRSLAYDRMVKDYHNSQSIIDSQWDSQRAALNSRKDSFLNDYASKKNLARVASGIAAGAAVASIYHSARAKAAKTRLTDIGHAEAVAKYKAQADRIKRLRGSVRISEIRKAG